MVLKLSISGQIAPTIRERKNEVCAFELLFAWPFAGGLLPALPLPEQEGAGLGLGKLSAYGEGQGSAMSSPSLLCRGCVESGVGSRRSGRSSKDSKVMLARLKPLKVLSCNKPQKAKNCGMQYVLIVIANSFVSSCAAVWSRWRAQKFNHI